jgi:hypothetical protein
MQNHHEIVVQGRKCKFGEGCARSVILKHEAQVDASLKSTMGRRDRIAGWAQVCTKVAERTAVDFPTGKDSVLPQVQARVIPNWPRAGP